MPTSKATLDLEAWNNFLMQERSNDYEYNILLYKFKAFFNEVKDFQELHSDCSVAKASSTELPSYGHTSLSNNNNGISSNNLNSASCSLPPILNKNNNHHFIPKNRRCDKKQIFQHQNSVPSNHPGCLELHREKDLLCKNSDNQNNFSSSSPPQRQDIGIVKHYNSSYNLASIAKNNPANNVRAVRPEVRQRNQLTSSSRLLLSKSSERLDNLNNNHQPLVANHKNDDLVDHAKLYKFSQPIPRDDRYLKNESNIYDAVSPDDAPQETFNSNGNTTNNVAASIQNLNRLALIQKGKLEASKSSLGFGSSAVASKQTNPDSSIKQIVTNNRSSPNGNTDVKISNSSLSPSVILDATNNSSSSLSRLPSLPIKECSAGGEHYSNYVNIDFFLKRGSSPQSFDGLEDDTTNDDSSGELDGEDSNQLSQSLSSDQICDEVTRERSASKIMKQLMNKEKDSSSNSITPASSGDFLDDQRNSSLNQVIQPSQIRYNEASSKFSSFLSSGNTHENDSLNVIAKSSTSPRDKNSFYQHQNLKAIHDSSTSFTPLKQTASLDSSQIDKDGNALVEAQNTMRSFLSDLNLSPIDDVFEDKAQRKIVKESFAVEFCGRRKLRHLFLFNDVIVCAKYQASSKQKFTFDVKWYLNLSGISILDLSDTSNQVKYDKEAIENQILAIRTNLILLRGQMQHIKRSKHKQPAKIIKKLKKKRTELEAELVLLLPHLPLVIKHLNGKKYTFFLSSNFDRNQWIESIKFLQSQLPSSKSFSTSPSSSELQAWIQTCRKNLNPSLGTFLLRSNCDDDLLYGDLCVNLKNIQGITKPGNFYFCFEVDSYGHFSQKASSAILHIETPERVLNEDYLFPLDGAHTLRILLYENLGSNTKPSVIGKAHIELSRACFLEKPVDKAIIFNSNCVLNTQLSYSSCELLSNRIPHAKLCPTFGVDITQVCKKEKTNVPLLIQLCVNEVERRGMREVGIYRMSGTSTDIQRLKKAFETNPYVAEILLRDIDINSVTGFLKTYLREIPEGLFSNKLYLKFVSAFNLPHSESLKKTKTMLELFNKIPITNQHTIIYLVEHLVKVNKYENHNKMSLTNLATVLGPNILRSPTDSSGSNSDPFTAVVIGSMSQAGILYFFLNRKYSNLSLTELEASEIVSKQS